MVIIKTLIPGWIPEKAFMFYGDMKSGVMSCGYEINPTRVSIPVYVTVYHYVD